MVNSILKAVLSVRSLCFIGLLVSMAFCSPASVADDGSNKTTSATALKNDSSSKSNSLGLSDKETDNALQFAKRHHPELASLLKNLSGKSSTEFKRGIREVHLAMVRLKRLQEKQPARFETELKQWKFDSEIRLLSAKFIVSGDQKLEKKIQAMLRQRQENRLKRLESERARLADRLKQLDEQINMDAAGLEAALDSEWERLAKRSVAIRKSRKQATAKKTNNSRSAKTDKKK